MRTWGKKGEKEGRREKKPYLKRRVEEKGGIATSSF